MTVEFKDNEVATLAGQTDELTLDVNGKGEIRANLNNATLIIEHDPTLAGLVWYDDFLKRILTGNPPREWSDVDDINVTLHIQRNCGMPTIGTDIVSKAIMAVAHRHKRNCVQNYLDSLTWDGEPRIDHFFEDHFGAPGNLYTRAASRNFFISAVARIRRPGCKVDSVIVVEGPQGIGKSRVFQVIGGHWFTEQHESASNPKAFAEIIQGKWIIEISEMDSFSRAEVTRVKQVITNPSDRYRVSYGRHAEDHPRQCVFVGTTNRDDWNRDETGARRFWPIACSGEIDIKGVEANRDQFFAEADHRFKAGETWWEMPAEETRQQQEQRFDADAWTEPIQDYIHLKSKVTVNEILTECLKFDLSKFGRPDQMRVATCLRSLGWVKSQGRVENRVVKVWKRKDESE